MRTTSIFIFFLIIISMSTSCGDDMTDPVELNPNFSWKFEGNSVDWMPTSLFGTYSADFLTIQAIGIDAEARPLSITFGTLAPSKGTYVLDNDDDNFFLYIQDIVDGYVTKDGHTATIEITTLNEDRAVGTFEAELVKIDDPSDIKILKDGKFDVELGF